MWTGTLATWLLSIPTLALTILCMQDFMGVVNGGYANNWAEYLVQLVGRRAAIGLMVLFWLDNSLCASICILR